MAFSNFTSIPTIDLSKVTSPASKTELLYDLRYALLAVGFLYITNHSVPDHVIRELVDALPMLFELPSSSKPEIALENSPHSLGYSSAGTAAVSNFGIFGLLLCLLNLVSVRSQYIVF